MAFDPSATRSGTVFSDNPGYLGAWICYVNGIEIPIQGFAGTSGVWQPPQFEIYLQPDPMLQRLGAEDRIPVQIFYLDHWYNRDRPEFRLLMDGEIIGYRSKKVSGQRVMSFTCMSHVRIFEKLYFFFMNTVDDVLAAQSPEVRSQGFTGQGLFYPYSLFHQGLMAPAGTGNQNEVLTDSPETSTGDGAMVKTPFEIFYNVIKGILSPPPKVPDENRTLPMMNFFARYMRKVRFHQRCVRVPLLEDIAAVQDRKGVFPIFNAVRSDEALAAMQHQVAGRIGNSGSVWEMFRQIYGLVYMEFACIANPAAVITNLEGEIQGAVNPDAPLIEQRTDAQEGLSAAPANLLATVSATQRREVGAGQNSEFTVGQDPTAPIRLAQFFVKPQFMFGQPPHCNVIFPSQIDDFSYGEDYSDQPTRIYVNDSVMSRVMQTAGANREFLLHALTVAYPDEADAVMHAHSAAGTAAATSQETGKNLLIWPEEFFKGPVTARMELPSWFQTLIQFRNAAGDGGGDGGGTPGSVSSAITGTDLTLTNVGPVTVIPLRGRVDSRGYLPESWIPSLAAQEYGESLPSIRSDQGDDGFFVGMQREPTDAFKALVRAMLRQFPGINHAEFKRDRDRRTNRNDIHLYGRAVDLMITRRGHGLPNHAVGDAVANWIIMHAAEIGIQYFIWATTQWWGEWTRGRGPRHSPYGLTLPQDNDSRLHRDHIHMEINIEGSLARTPWFRQNGIPPIPGDIPPRSATRRRPNRPVEPTVASTPIASAAPVHTVTHVVAVPTVAAATPAAPGTAAASPADRAHVITTNGAVPTPEAGELPNDQKFAEMFRLYAQYEFLRQRYSQRNASATLQFNPYLVPGFPCVVFDRSPTKEHIVAYITTVNQQASAAGGGSIGTSCTMTAVRTLGEFLHDVAMDCERFSERVTAAPAEIIPEIRQIIQDEDRAEALYTRLFYGSERTDGATAAFHFDQALGYSRGLTAERIDIRQEAGVGIPATTDANGMGTPAVPTRTVRHNLDPNEDIVPLPDTPYADAFANYDVAQQLSSRNVCSLTEFIRFWHGGRTVGDLISAGEVEGAEDTFSYRQVVEQDAVAQGVARDGARTVTLGVSERQSATYFKRIFRLRPGPGRQPNEQERGYTAGANATASAGTAGVPSDYPETRADWDTVLLEYREKLRSRLTPST